MTPEPEPLRRLECRTLGNGTDYCTEYDEGGPFVYADEAEATIKARDERIAELERGIDAAAQKASTRVADMPGADPLVVLREVEVDLENLLKEMEEKP